MSDQPSRPPDESMTLQPVERDAGAFLVMLSNLSEGKVAEDAAAAIKDITLAVKQLAKKGSLVLEITVEPVKKSTNAVMLSGSLKVKKPTETRPPDFMFTGPDGSLLRDRPDQHALIGVNRPENI